MKKAILIGVVIMALIVGYIAAGPYLTVTAIQASIAENDSEKLSKNIEFPVLRQNLKEQLNSALMKNTATEVNNNPFTVLTTGLATKMIDGIVDSFVTPSGLATLMSGGKPSNFDSENASLPEKDDLFKNSRFSYDSTNKFSIWVPDNMGREIRFVLHRGGFSWKLANLVIPIDGPLID